MKIKTFTETVERNLQSIKGNDQDVKLTKAALQQALETLKKNTSHKLPKSNLTLEDIQPFIECLANRWERINPQHVQPYTRCGTPVVSIACQNIANALAGIINGINQSGKRCRLDELLMPVIKVKEEETIADIPELVLGKDDPQLDQMCESVVVNEVKTETLAALIQQVINHHFQHEFIETISYDRLFNLFFNRNNLPDPKLTSGELLKLAIKNISFEQYNLEEEKALFILLAHFYRCKRSTEPEFNRYLLGYFPFGSNQQDKTSAASLFENRMQTVWPENFSREKIDSYLAQYKLEGYKAALYSGHFSDLMQKAIERAAIRNNKAASNNVFSITKAV